LCLSPLGLKLNRYIKELIIIFPFSAIWKHTFNPLDIDIKDEARDGETSQLVHDIEA
jgi:hypothetical protein